VIRVNVKDFMEDLTLGSYDDCNRIISTHSQRYAAFLDIFTSSISFIIFQIHVRKILIRDLFSSDVIQITIMFLIFTFSTLCLALHFQNVKVLMLYGKNSR
jgi:hypothetical protein